MQELAVLLLGSIRPPLGLQELQNQRPPSTNVAPPGQEISPNQRFKNAGFSAALASYHCHLRKLDRGLAAELREDVLELVDDRNHGVTERSSRRRRMSWNGRDGFFRHGFAEIGVGKTLEAVEGFRERKRKRRERKWSDFLVRNFCGFEFLRFELGFSGLGFC